MLRTPRSTRATRPAPCAAALVARLAPFALLGPLALLALLAAPLAVAAQPTTPPAADPAALASQPPAAAPTSREVPRLAVEIFDGVMSPFCPGLLLSNCPSPSADSLRNAIVERVERGDSRATIEAELYETYGEAVRAAPKAEGFGLVAWLAPAVVLVGGGLWLAVWLRRASTRRARGTGPGRAGGATGASSASSPSGASGAAGPALVPAGGAAADPARADDLARLDRLVRGERGS